MRQVISYEFIIVVFVIVFVINITVMIITTIVVDATLSFVPGRKGQKVLFQNFCRF